MALLWREVKSDTMLKPALVSTDNAWMIVERDWQWSVHKRNEHDVFELLTYCDSLAKAKQYAQQLAGE